MLTKYTVHTHIREGTAYQKHLPSEAVTLDEHYKHNVMITTP